jgi:putative DNA primase/helicase
VSKYGIHEPLKGKIVRVVPDNDDPGREHADAIARTLVGFAASVKVIDLPGLSAKADVTDFINIHGSEKARRLLNELAENIPEYESSSVGTEVAIQQNLTDMGNAGRMAAFCGDSVRYCNQLGWLVYDGKRWIRDEMSRLQTFAKETVRRMYEDAAGMADEDGRRALAAFALKCESLSRIQAMLALLPSEPGISVSHDVFDRDKMLFNVRNGTIDLRKGDLRPHSKADLITKLSPVNYDPDATCPRWSRFIFEIMAGDEELVRFLQRLMGYSLTGETREQVWVFFWGKGENGKGTFLEAIAHVLGDYAVNTPPETFLEIPGSAVRNDLARLRGARLITASEPDGKRKFDPGTLKTFTGQDPITCRFLHKEFFEFQPEGKLIFSANQRPAVRDTSHGFWRRVILVPFSRTFTGSEKDANLRETLKAEASGILNWLIEGCLQWQAEGLNPPAAVRDAVEEYRTETDVLAEFLETYCEIDESKSIPVSELYPAYSTYCDENKIRKGLSRQRFNEDLLGRPGITQDRIGPKRTRSWIGIGFKTNTAENVTQADFGRKRPEKTCDRCDYESIACPMPQVERNAATCSYYKGM